MPYLFLIPSFIFFILFTVWPIIKVLELSLFQTNFITTSFVGLQNYIDSFNNPMFLLSLKNSVFYIILMVSGTILLSLFIALTVSKLPKKWQDSSRILLYIPVLAGGIIIAQVWRWIFSANGVVNWLLSVFGIGTINLFGQGSTAIPLVVFIVILSSFGSYVIILLASITSIDKGIFEAATIDGASHRQIQWQITIPLLMPTILLIGLLAMIASMQIVETIMVLVPQDFAFTPTYEIYATGFKYSKWGMASAQSVILMVVTVILSLIKGRVERNGR